jgi:hypothetical protein
LDAGGGVVYTVLGSVLTPNITASVANRYAGKNILQMPFLGTARPKPRIVFSYIANTLFVNNSCTKGRPWWPVTTCPRSTPVTPWYGRAQHNNPV